MRLDFDWQSADKPCLTLQYKDDVLVALYFTTVTVSQPEEDKLFAFRSYDTTPIPSWLRTIRLDHDIIVTISHDTTNIKADTGLIEIVFNQESTFRFSITTKQAIDLVSKLDLDIREYYDPRYGLLITPYQDIILLTNTSYLHLVSSVELKRNLSLNIN